VVNSRVDKEDNVLHNAPHTLLELTDDEWNHSYSRKEAAYPAGIKNGITKFWPAVARVDNAYGDRNLVCTCPPLESYIDEPEIEKI